MQITVAMRTRPLIVVAIKTWPQMLTQSSAENERNFETLNETSLENSFHQTKYRSMFRTIRRNFEHAKTIALRNFFETSKNFRFLRNTAGFRLYSSKFALNTFPQYCTLKSLPYSR